jgi:hypothetical protein
LAWLFHYSLTCVEIWFVGQFKNSGLSVLRHTGSRFSPLPYQERSRRQSTSRISAAFLWCWWASFNEDEGEEGKREEKKKSQYRLIRWNEEQNDHGTTSPEPPSLCTKRLTISLPK